MMSSGSGEGLRPWTNVDKLIRPACNHGPVSGFPVDPARITTADDLVEQLAVLRKAGAAGTGKAKVSLDEVSARTGIPRSTIHSYLSGRVIPPPDALDAMLAALGVPLEDMPAWAAALERIHARRTHRAAQRAEGAAARASEVEAFPLAPQQLPRGVPLIDRDDELARLDSLWSDPDERTPVAVLVGPGGIGKTSLALAWAHRHLADFPDGQLFVDLHGFGADEAADPERILHRFLPSLGVDRPSGELPELQAQFRTLTAGKRLLMVLDNAHDATQVQALLPGSESVMVLVTCRHDLRALAVFAGAAVVPVGPLPDAAAERILVQTPGIDRETAADITARCGGLPLALRLVAARLAAGGTLEPARATASDARDIIRGALDDTWDALSADARRLALRLAVAPGPWLPDELAAVLADRPGPVLAELAGVRLVQRDDRRRGWVRHDQITEYLLRRARADAPAYRSDLARALRWAGAVALSLHPPRLAAARRLVGDLPVATSVAPDRTTTMTRHGELMLMLARLGIANGQLRAAAIVVSQMCTYLATLGIVLVLRQVLDHLLEAAEQQGDDLVACIAHCNLSMIPAESGREEDVIAELDAALATRTAGELPELRTQLLYGRSYSLVLLGRYSEAERDVLAAVELASSLQLWRELCEAENNYGLLLQEQGRREEAAAAYRDAVRHGLADSPAAAALPLVNLLSLLLRDGRLDEASGYLAELDRIQPRVPSGALHVAVYTVRSQAAVASGRPGEAVVLAEHAVAQAHQQGDASYRLQARTQLAEAYLADRQVSRARDLAHEIIQDTERAGYLSIAADAYSVLVAADLAAGDQAAAERDRRAAEDVSARTNRPGWAAELQARVAALVASAR